MNMILLFKFSAFYLISILFCQNRISCSSSSSADVEFEKGFGIFRQSYENYALSHYHSQPCEESLFASAIESVRLDVDVRVLSILPAIISKLTDIYFDFATKAIKFLKVDASSFVDNAMIIVPFFHEANIIAHYQCTETQAMVFFEFIFRFGIYSSRYSANLNLLLKIVKPENYHLIYRIILKHFNPRTSALPLFCPGDEFTENPQLKIDFSEFQNLIYEKMITEIGEATEIYFDNIGVVLMIMILGDSLDDFGQIPIDLVMRSNVSVFTMSKIFVKTFNAAKTRGTLPVSFINSLLAKLVNDSFILSTSSKSTDQFLYSSFIDGLDYSYSAESLSSEASKILADLSSKHFDHKLAIEKLYLFTTLKDDFLNMNILDLIELRSGINILIPVIYNECELHFKEISSVISHLISYLPELISSSYRDQMSQDLTIERYRTFVILLNFCTSTNYILTHTEELFVKILFFYNCQLHQVQLDEIHQTNLIILKRLSKRDRIFQIKGYFAILLKYLQFADPTEAENIINSLIFNFMRSRTNTLFGVARAIKAGSTFKISLRTAFSAFIGAEFADYLPERDRIEIESYKNSELINFTNSIIRSGHLSKTETGMVKKFILQYSRSKDIVRMVLDF